MQCCCPCNCCDITASDDIQGLLIEWTSVNGNTNGALSQGTLSTDSCYDECGDDAAQTCLGRIDFEVTYTNGVCQRNQTKPGYACLCRREDLGDGFCCYWKIYLEPPDIECLDPATTLGAGWPCPPGSPVILPYCLGSNSDDCQFITTDDPCYDICEICGFSSVTFATSLTGNCQCEEDV